MRTRNVPSSGRLEPSMWFGFWRPDYFYCRHSTIIDSSDGWIGFNQGFGFFVLSVRWRKKSRWKNITP